MTPQASESGTPPRSRRSPGLSGAASFPNGYRYKSPAFTASPGPLLWARPQAPGRLCPARGQSPHPFGWRIRAVWPLPASCGLAGRLP